MKIKKIIDCSQTFFHNNPGYMPYELCEINYETLIPKDGYQSRRRCTPRRWRQAPSRRPM